MFYTQADRRARGTRGRACAVAGVCSSRASSWSTLQPPFPVDPAAEALGRSASREMFGGKPLAILNPGAGWGAKCWPTESFGTVARALAERGMAVIVNHGPGEEALADAFVAPAAEWPSR